MRSREKGFFSIDAMFALALLLMVILSFTNIYRGRSETSQLSSARFEAIMVGEQLAAGINSVYANGSNLENENTDLYINLPQKIGDFDYSISFYDIERKIILDLPSVGITTETIVACNNVVIQELDLSGRIRIHWENENIEVVNA